MYMCIYIYIYIYQGQNKPISFVFWQFQLRGLSSLSWKASVTAVTSDLHSWCVQFSCESPCIYTYAFKSMPLTLWLVLSPLPSGPRGGDKELE